MLQQAARAFDQFAIERSQTRRLPRQPLPPGGILTTGQLIGRGQHLVSAMRHFQGRTSLFRHSQLRLLETKDVNVIDADLLRANMGRLLRESRWVRAIASPLVGGEAGRNPADLACLVVRNLIEREQIAVARNLLEALPLGLVDDPSLARLRKTLALPVVKTSDKLDIDRQDDYKWIRDYGREYQGQWVAVDKGQLLAVAGTLRELLELVKRLPLGGRPLLHRIQ